MHSLTRRKFMRIGAGSVAAGPSRRSPCWSPLPCGAQTVQWRRAIGCDLPRSERVRADANCWKRHCWCPASSVSACAISTTAGTRRLRSPCRNRFWPRAIINEILDRKDVDAVIVAVADHQHRRIVVDACAAGKDVYCEKPMSHTVEDGFAMVDAVHKGNRILQVGSQRVSSIVYEKARELYASGALGEVFFIEGSSDRNSPSGAWVYPIPPDASEQTIDWNAFLEGAPKRPFDAARFFRWRCYSDYGEGLAGDLFVHLLSGIHFISGTNEARSGRSRAADCFAGKMDGTFRT